MDNIKRADFKILHKSNKHLVINFIFKNNYTYVLCSSYIGFTRNLLYMFSMFAYFTSQMSFCKNFTVI